ncbi:MAG: DUF1353 domain-containing protein [Candidatus Altimarinota bacterium]
MKYTTAVALFQNGSLIKQSNTNKWIVENMFIWEVVYGTRFECQKIKVPSGFITDMGSIPQIFWVFFNPTQYLAYILHDYLYHQKGKIYTHKETYYEYSRKDCDKMLYEAMKVEGAWWITRACVYLGVRIGGWVAWKK